MIVKFNIQPHEPHVVLGEGPTDEERYSLRGKVDNYMKCLSHCEYLGGSGFSTSWRLTSNEEFTLGSFMDCFRTLNETAPDNMVVSTSFWSD